MSSRRLFEYAPVSKEIVQSILDKYYNGIKILKKLKESHNVTYSAELNGTNYIVRATARPEILPRVQDEVFFLNYVSKNGLNVCNTIEPSLICEEDIIVSVYSWARGKEIDRLSYHWCTDKEEVIQQGAWLKSLHALSKQFAKEHEEVANRIQNWDENLGGVLKGCDPDIPINLDTFGIIHGDINTSNYYLEEDKSMCVFDWDQLQRGWYLYDLASMCYSVWTISKNGNEATGERVAGLDFMKYVEWTLEGYGAGMDMKDDLFKCIKMRVQLYENFCRRAQKEGDMPSSMADFINKVVKDFDEGKVKFDLI